MLNQLHTRGMTRSSDNCEPSVGLIFRKLPLVAMLFALAHQLLSAATHRAHGSLNDPTTRPKRFGTALFGVCDRAGSAVHS